MSALSFQMVNNGRPLARAITLVAIVIGHVYGKLAVDSQDAKN